MLADCKSVNIGNLVDGEKRHSLSGRARHAEFALPHRLRSRALLERHLEQLIELSIGQLFSIEQPTKCLLLPTWPCFDPRGDFLKRIAFAKRPSHGGMITFRHDEHPRENRVERDSC